MEHDKKKSEELLAELFRNCQLALQSITNILPETAEGKIRDEILTEQDEYEQFSGRVAILAKDKNIEVKEPNMMKKAMMWGSIKMSTLTDNSHQHITEMMIQGTVMGITALKTSLSDAETHADEEIIALLKELISLEEGFEKTLKEYL